MEENWHAESVFSVDRFLSDSECDEYIRMSEDIGYEDALVTTAVGAMRLTNVRNNERVIFHNHAFAEKLWERAIDFAPTECDGRHAVGLNEMFRFYRYDPGQQFNWHQDGFYERDNGERSYWTFMIYLNDGYTGGETSFDDSCSDDTFDDFSVAPKKGMALFFEHSVHHKGEPVASGRKYVLRTDVMYSANEDSDDPSSWDDWN